MSTEYSQAERPVKYWVKNIDCKCNSCEVTFSEILPHGNEIIKFIETDGHEVRWLPTYEKGGYFELLKQLVPGFDAKSQEITMSISNKFQSAFEKIQQPSVNGKKFRFAKGVICPKCKSNDIKIISDKILLSPTLKWMKYLSEF